MNDRTSVLWFVAMAGFSALALVLAYFVNWIAAVVFWAIATLVLLAVRPY